jgi:hypothetical protein
MHVNVENRTTKYQLTFVAVIVITTILLVVFFMWLFSNFLFPLMNAEHGMVRDFVGIYRFPPSQTNGVMQLLLGLIVFVFLCVLEVLPLFIIGYMIIVLVAFVTAFSMSMFLDKAEFIKVFGAADRWRRFYPLGHLIKLIGLKYNGN